MRFSAVPAVRTCEALMLGVPVNLQVWTRRTQFLNLSRGAPLPSGTRCQAAADEVADGEPMTVDNSTSSVSLFVKRSLRFDLRMVERRR